MSIQQFLTDFNIPNKPDREGKWIQICCPFCTDSKFHGGINIQKDYFHCWKCGWHPIDETLHQASGVQISDIKPYLKDAFKRVYSPVERFSKPKSYNLSFPAGTTPIIEAHRDYLSARKFDSYQLEKDYSIKGTTHLGDYKFRIMIPIYLDEKMVSYQGRDITGKSKIKYKACKKEDEIIYHQHILYGVDKAGDTAIIVEGVFDAWRVGAGACAIFGISFSQEQVNFIGKRFKKTYICFDNEEEAQEQAEKLQFNLIGLGRVSELVSIDAKDPAELSGRELMRLQKLLR